MDATQLESELPPSAASLAGADPKSVDSRDGTPTTDSGRPRAALPPPLDDPREFLGPLLAGCHPLAVPRSDRLAGRVCFTRAALRVDDRSRNVRLGLSIDALSIVAAVIDARARARVVRAPIPPGRT